MSNSSPQSLQAALSAAVIAAVNAFIILAYGNKSTDDLSILVPIAAMVTFVTTFILWRFAFTDPKTQTNHGLWLGPLIVFISLVMMNILSSLLTVEIGRMRILSCLDELILLSLLFSTIGFVLFSPL